MFIDFLVEKVTNPTTTNPNDDGSSCSSTGAGEGSSTSSSTVIAKQSMHSTTTIADLDSLPPNKRRLRDRNTVISGTSIPPNPLETSTNSNSNSITEHSPVDSISTREIPVNGIKQFLEIRQQVSLDSYPLQQIERLTQIEISTSKRSYSLSLSIVPSFFASQSQVLSSIQVQSYL